MDFDLDLELELLERDLERLRECDERLLDLDEDDDDDELLPLRRFFLLGGEPDLDLERLKDETQKKQQLSLIKCGVQTKNYWPRSFSCSHIDVSLSPHMNKQKGPGVIFTSKLNQLGQ